MPNSMKKAGTLTFRKLAFYVDSGEHSATNSLIYCLKHRKINRVACFIAKELLSALNAELETIEASDDEVIITHVPRGKRAKILHGFDQSEMVCKQITKLTNIPHVSLFRCVISKEQQKELNSTARIKHANDTILIRNKSDVNNKYIVLFDDIVTTGASMSACTRQLMKAGAKGVICLSLASRQKK